WVTPQEENVYLDMQIVPLLETGNVPIGASISFIDVTRYERLRGELEQSNEALEMAYEELQCTNEELETTNEELQSSNEELETMNEELQSANEELHELNEELQRRSQELNQSNAFLEAILTSFKRGVVVIDRDLQVQLWNHKAEDLWGLRTEEVLGQNFLSLDIGLPTEKLLQPIRACLTKSAFNESESLLPAINRRGRSIQCSVTCTPLFSAQDEVISVILVMEDRQLPLE
ncbi:MAG TPA: PAS domain-containing protein, partial [Leptolyngbyaceae cyanobacterium]